MCVARIFNLPTTLDAVGWPEPWGRRGARVLVAARALHGTRAIYTAAYNTCNGCPRGTPLINYQKLRLDTLWTNRAALQPSEHDTLRAVYERLKTQLGMGTFMSNQVVADLKHGSVLRAASDWHTFAASGSGSLRGMNRLCGRPVKQRQREDAWHDELLTLRKTLVPSLPKSLRDLDAQNLEHGLCEFDKWMRAGDEGRKLTRPFKPTLEDYK